MPLNLTKKYNKLLELVHLNEKERLASLHNIFNRDIVNNPHFKFREKMIRPIMKDGLPALDILFKHLTYRSIEKTDEKGKKYNSREVFDFKRSERLHWIWHHIQEKEDIKIFSVNDRVKGRNKIRTYLFDEKESYVIILEPFRRTNDYYLLSAYYLQKEYGGIKTIQKKYRRRLNEVY